MIKLSLFLFGTFAVLVLFIVAGFVFRSDELPIPQVQSPAPSPSLARPHPTSYKEPQIKFLLFEEVVGLLYEGKVLHVESYNQNVTISLVDGATVWTKEPYVDAIFDEIYKCGEPCSSMYPVVDPVPGK